MVTCTNDLLPVPRAKVRATALLCDRGRGNGAMCANRSDVHILFDRGKGDAACLHLYLYKYLYLYLYLHICICICISICICADPQPGMRRLPTTYLGHADPQPLVSLRPTSGMRIPLRPTSGMRILRHLYRWLRRCFRRRWRWAPFDGVGCGLGGGV